MKKLPTDLKIFQTIYDTYIDDYLNYDSETNNTRTSKPYVPIDLDKLAEKLGIEADLLFGRLYYHVEKKYGYEVEENRFVFFFTTHYDSAKNVINFPYMVSVLASLRHERRKFALSTVISIIALGVSMVALMK